MTESMNEIGKVNIFYEGLNAEFIASRAMYESIVLDWLDPAIAHVQCEGKINDADANIVRHTIKSDSIVSVDMLVINSM